MQRRAFLMAARACVRSAPARCRHQTRACGQSQTSTLRTDAPRFTQNPQASQHSVTFLESSPWRTLPKHSQKQHSSQSVCALVTLQP